VANKVTGPDPLLALMKSISAGLSKLPSALTGISIEGTTYTGATLATKLATYTGPFQAAEDADTAKQVADQARDALKAEAHAFTMDTVRALKAALGRTSPTLETVGITPDKVPAPLTAAQKVTRAEKAASTRKARGTMGKKQLAKIHGTVPATPAPAATPAATPKPGS
jgi:hypothetical protein